MNHSAFPIFPSVILQSVDSEFKVQNDLIQWIYSYQKSQSNSISRSNHNGWQSDTQFYKTCPYFDYIEKRIQSLISEYHTQKFRILNMWINVNYPGSHNSLHCHPSSHLSGVLWIDADDDSGRLIFEHPNQYAQYDVIDSIHDYINHQFNYFKVFYFNPNPGSMIIFPSDLMHKVDMNHSNSNRISISFNLSLFS